MEHLDVQELTDERFRQFAFPAFSIAEGLMVGISLAIGSQSAIGTTRPTS